MDFEDNNPLCAETSPRSHPTTPPPLTSSKIEIIDAGKHREGTQRGHITYTIRVPDGTTIRRRYSEFESLRRMLRRLFPTLIVPPIPEKHSITAYAASPAHAHEDARIIDHRKRMLGVFLNRCSNYPQIRDSEILKKFLDPNSVWAEVLASESLARVPKSPLQAPPLDPAAAEPAHAYLPIPPSGARLKNDADPEFNAAEARAKEYEAYIGGGLDKSTRRMISRYSSLANDHADLGSQFNAFSLESANSVAPAVEKVGQAVDTGYLTAKALVEGLNVKLSEPLAESAQLAATARAILKYRRYRAIQVDMATDALAARRRSLEQLEKAESEAKRINDYLHTDERIAKAMQDDVESIASAASAVSEPEVREPREPEPEPEPAREPEGEPREPELDTHEPLEPVESHGSQGQSQGQGAGQSQASQSSSQGQSSHRGIPKRLRLPGFSSINYAISGMMDADPESARRNNISRTQLQIKNLEAAVEIAKQDSKVASTAVKEELDRYNQVKEQDLNQLVRAFVRCHIEWAEKNLAAWVEARQAISE